MFIIGLCLCLYFSYHAMHGKRSIFQVMDVQSEIKQAETELALLRAQREDLEKQVISMREGSLRLDLLEEQVRRILGYKYPGEFSLPSH